MNIRIGEIAFRPLSKQYFDLSSSKINQKATRSLIGRSILSFGMIKSYNAVYGLKFNVSCLEIMVAPPSISSFYYTGNSGCHSRRKPFCSRIIPVDWNEGGDSCRNSTSGKSIFVAAPLPQKLVGAVPAESVRRNGNQRHRRKSENKDDFRSCSR